MEGKIPNVPHTLELPADFETHARSYGLSVGELTWLLVADFQARLPASITVKALGRTLTRRPAPNIIPFPGREEAA